MYEPVPPVAFEGCESSLAPPARPVGVVAELEEQSLVFEPQLQGLPVQPNMSKHPVVGSEQAARHPVVDLRRLVHCFISSRGFAAPGSRKPAKKEPERPFVGAPA